MHIDLLQHTRDPETVVAQAAKLCYSAAGLADIAEALTPEKTAAFIRKLIDLGHWSALEHASFTFGIEEVSRALTHQLVRHRLASFSQQSQRYVTLRQFAHVVPPSIAARPDLRERFDRAMLDLGEVYGDLLDAGVPAEDARYVLPNACASKIVVTMNARELRHFFLLRCCQRAQWEIRELAERMLDLARAVAPQLFAQAGPGCVTGPCPEGAMSCGQSREMRQRYQAAGKPAGEPSA